MPNPQSGSSFERAPAPDPEPVRPETGAVSSPGDTDSPEVADASGESTAEPVVPPGATMEERIEILQKLVDQERTKHYPPPEVYSYDQNHNDQMMRKAAETAAQKRVNDTFPKPSKNPTPEEYPLLAGLARKYNVPLVDMPEVSGPREFSAAPETTGLDADALYAANDHLRVLEGVNSVYRCDQRYPAEILEDDGFRPRERPNTENGSGYDLHDHVNSSGWSNFVSTSTDLYETIKRVNTRGLGNASFVYTMEAPGGIDVNRSLDNGMYSGEQEIAFAGGVDNRYITGAYMVERTDSGEETVTWIPCERFAEFSRPSGAG